MLVEVPVQQLIFVCFLGDVMSCSARKVVINTGQFRWTSSIAADFDCGDLKFVETLFSRNH